MFEVCGLKIKSNIFINGLRLYAFHGVMEQERRVGGEFSVDLRVHYYIYKAMETDRVEDTVSYASLCDIVKREMAQPSALLEHVGGRVAKAVLAAFPQVEAVNVKITKLNPPMGADCDGAGVEIEVTSDECERHEEE